MKVQTVAQNAQFPVVVNPSESLNGANVKKRMSAADCKQMADNLLNGNGMAADPVKAIEYYKRAAHMGDIDSMFILGWLYENGVPNSKVAQDIPRAMAWYHCGKNARLDGKINGNVDRCTNALEILIKLHPHHIQEAAQRRKEINLPFPSILVNDFKPISEWDVDQSAPIFSGSNEKMYIIDKSTGRKYFNESKTTVGVKSGLLVLGTPIVHTVASVVNVVVRIFKIISGYEFWAKRPEELVYDFKARLCNWAADLGRIVAAPIFVVALELSALYGIFTPYNGRKLYASFERLFYGNFILAPCFQPDPKSHALGGDINVQDAW